EFNKFKRVPAMLKLIETQATKTALRMDMLGFATERSIRRMENTFKNAKLPDWWINAAATKGRFNLPGVGAGNAPGGVDESHPRNRPLFGGVGRGLEQGQAVQNAIMAMVPLLV